MLDAATATQEACFTALNVAAVTASAPRSGRMRRRSCPAMIRSNGSIVLVHSVSARADRRQGRRPRPGHRDADHRDRWCASPTRRRCTRCRPVRELLDGQAVTAFGALLSDPHHGRPEVELQEDGETYMGIQKFETIVQPA
jgi:hypothetical protein